MYTTEYNIHVHTHVRCGMLYLSSFLFFAHCVFTTYNFIIEQEVIMMLDQCRRDFSALIDRINVQDAFEKADYKDRYVQVVYVL